MEKPLILVVEDEPEMASFLVDLINETNRYDAVAAYNGKEAFEALAKHEFNVEVNFPGYDTVTQNRVECIILDLKMPEMNGLDFLGQLRFKTRKTSDEEKVLTIHIPVIILTAYEDPGKLTWAADPMDGEVVAYLKKPVKGKELLDMIDRVFQGTREVNNMIWDTRWKIYKRIEELTREALEKEYDTGKKKTAEEK